MSYVNEEPVPETRDMELEEWVEEWDADRDGFRILLNGHNISSHVWRISPTNPPTEPAVFYVPLEEGTWVYGPEGEWLRVEPEPRTYGQTIRDLFDRVSARLRDQIRAMLPARIYDASDFVYPTVGQWTPAEADNHQGLLHGDYNDGFRSEDPDDPFPPPPRRSQRTGQRLDSEIQHPTHNPADPPPAMDPRRRLLHVRTERDA